MRRLILFSALYLFLCGTLAWATVLSITSVTLTDTNAGTIQPFINDTAVMRCTGVIKNKEGAADITTLRAVFYASTSTQYAADSAGRHYTNTTCSKFTAAAQNVNYNCTMVVHHHISPGTWTCVVNGTDTEGNAVANDTETVDTLRAISLINSTIDFNTYKRNGNTGSEERSVFFNNTGNSPFRVQIDAYRVSGTASDTESMSCSSGTLTVGAVKYANISGVSAAAKTALTNTPLVTVGSYSPTAGGSTAYPNATLYFGLNLTASFGVRGACSGFVDLTAVP
ncbi:MAG TPA: hypothetical protein VK158_04050 [Acidobacteriota bacterium]|nr:hypothetical protein [Acidobacteriota bacterium]